MIKKSPTDATLRNTQAANKKIAKLSAEVKELKRQVKEIQEAFYEHMGVVLK